MQSIPIKLTREIIMAKTKPIRDPVHNYIPTTQIEISIIDRPDFQRLRFILQNSSAYLTYPSNTNTRFLHSLGVMHLSGLFFSKALENSNCNTLVNFIKSAENILRKSPLTAHVPKKTFVKTWSKILGNACRFAHDPLHGDRAVFLFNNDKYTIKVGNKKLAEDLEYDPCYVINTFWQALRLTALIHDMGHMPMSHLFESAIDHCKIYSPKSISSAVQNEFGSREKRYIELLAEESIRNEVQKQIESKDIKLHELRGLSLFRKFKVEATEEGGTTPHEDISYYSLIYYLAETIFSLRPTKPADEEEEDHYRTLRCLHGVVSGELDADRLDYCLRDPQASGLEYGAVDAQRIIDNMMLSESDDGIFSILPTDKALSAIESFFHQRYLVYNYLIYHHNVARMDGVLKEIISILIQQAFDPKTTEGNNLREFLKRFRFITDGKIGDLLLSDEYSHIYDDSWLRSLLAELLIMLNSFNSEEKPRWVDSLSLLTETFLYRKSNNLHSMWKRQTDIDDIYNKISIKLGVTLEYIYELSPLRIDKGKFEYISDTLRDAKKWLEDEKGVILINRDIKPKIFRVFDEKNSKKDSDKSLSILIEDQENKVWRPRKIWEVSPYIKSLEAVSDNSPNIHISLVSQNIKGDKKLQKECIEALIGSLSKYTSLYKDALEKKQVKNDDNNDKR